MGNRMSSAVSAVKRRKRAVVNTVSVGAIGALALGTLGTGVATAQNMITSDDIVDQTIQSQDIGQNAVGASEVGPNAIHKWNINQNSVGLYELNDFARNNLGSDKTTTDSTTPGLDEQVSLPAGDEVQVASLDDVSEGALVIGHVTVSGQGSNNNAVCSLVSGGEAFAEGNEKLGTEAAGQQNGSMTLAGVTPSSGSVTMTCHTGNGDFATDISLSTVEVG